MHLMTQYIAMTGFCFATIACTKSAQMDTGTDPSVETDADTGTKTAGDDGPPSSDDSDFGGSTDFESECTGEACLAHDTDTATAGNDTDSDSNADTDSASRTDSDVSCFDLEGDACAHAGCYPVEGMALDRENACRGSAEIVGCVPLEQSGCFTVVTAAKDADGSCWIFACSLIAPDMTYLGWDNDVLLENCGYTMSDIWDLPTCGFARRMD